MNESSAAAEPLETKNTPLPKPPYPASVKGLEGLKLAIDRIADGRLNTPSLVTLKRWSASGKLASAVTGRAKPITFDTSQALGIIRAEGYMNASASLAMEPDTPSPSLPSEEAAKPPSSHENNQEALQGARLSEADSRRVSDLLMRVDSLQAAVQSMTETLASLAPEIRKLAALSSSIQGLDDTRKMLMNRYDSEMQLLRERAGRPGSDSGQTGGSSGGGGDILFQTRVLNGLSAIRSLVEQSK